MDKCLNSYGLPKLKPENINNLDRAMTNKETRAKFKNSPQKNISELDPFIAKFYQTFKEILIPTLLKLFQKLKIRRTITEHSLQRQCHINAQTRQKHNKIENHQTTFLMNMDAKNPQQQQQKGET